MNNEIKELYPYFRNTLQEKEKETLSRINTERANFIEQVNTVPSDEADMSALDYSSDYFLKLADQHHSEIIHIRDALDKLQRGTYGICENCEEPIQVERLKKIPSVRLCIQCQRKREGRG